MQVASQTAWSLYFLHKEAPRTADAKCGKRHRLPSVSILDCSSRITPVCAADQRFILRPHTPRMDGWQGCFDGQQQSARKLAIDALIKSGALSERSERGPSPSGGVKSLEQMALDTMALMALDGAKEQVSDFGQRWTEVANALTKGSPDEKESALNVLETQLRSEDYVAGRAVLNADFALVAAVHPLLEIKSSERGWERGWELPGITRWYDLLMSWLFHRATKAGVELSCVTPAPVTITEQSLIRVAIRNTRVKIREPLSALVREVMIRYMSNEWWQPYGWWQEKDTVARVVEQMKNDKSTKLKDETAMKLKELLNGDTIDLYHSLLCKFYPAHQQTE